MTKNSPNLSADADDAALSADADDAALAADADDANPLPISNTACSN